jgi:GTP-binding protein HflX
MGSRGPGETKIELDRRRINQRMAKLRREIKEMKTGRDTKRSGRKANGVPSVAIAGYTNAGKSSLLNRLTGAGVLVENQLFATLDPTVRRAETPDGRLYTLADTVGFVRQLPTQLVEAFRSTLEEVADADLLLHVVDGSHPDPEGQITAVRAVLADVDAADVKEVIVVNKADAADPEVLDRLRRHEKHCIVVSARTGQGITELRDLIADELPRPTIDVDVLLPYERGDLVSRLHDEGEIIGSEHTSDGTRVKARVHPDLAAELTAYHWPSDLTVSTASCAVPLTDSTDAFAGSLRCSAASLATDCASSITGCAFSLTVDAAARSFSLAGSREPSSQPAPSAITPAASGLPCVLRLAA